MTLCSSNAMHRCVLRYFGVLFWCELSLASSLRLLLSSDAPNDFVCFSYRGGCSGFLKWSFGVQKGVCKLKIAIKSHRDLNPAAARRSLALPRTCAFPTVTSYLLYLFKFLWFLFSRIPTSPRKTHKFAPRKNSRYAVYTVNYAK